jgi:hypothetical protein
MIPNLQTTIAGLSALACMWVISCACARTHDVDSFVTLHRDMRLIAAKTVGEPLTVDERVEQRTAFTKEKLSLRPGIGGYEISVQLDSRAGADRPTRYRELDEHGLENTFIVSQGPPPRVPVPLESRHAAVNELEVPADVRTRLEALRPEGAEIEEIRGVHYVIGWNGNRLEGRAYILRMSHVEPDHLLD